MAGGIGLAIAVVTGLLGMLIGYIVYLIGSAVLRDGGDNRAE